MAIGSSTNKSLEQMSLVDNNIADDEMVDIITALTMHPNLRHLNLDGNRLCKKGCVALSKLLRSSAIQLQSLDLAENKIDDDGLEVLIPALKGSTELLALRLADNDSITASGWQRLATILEAPNFNLAKLDLASNNINNCKFDDEAVALYAKVLTLNCTLKSLIFNNPITRDSS